MALRLPAIGGRADFNTTGKATISNKDGGAMRQEHLDGGQSPPKAAGRRRARDGPAPPHIQTVEVLSAPAHAVEKLIRRFPAVLRLAGPGHIQYGRRGLISSTETPPPLFPTNSAAIFRNFWTKCHAANNLPYLPDLARFEWLRWKAWQAPERPSLSGKYLCAVPPALAPRLIFETQPSLGIIASPYSIVSIWETYGADDETRRKNLRRGWEEAMVVRGGRRCVRIRRMPPGAYQFIDKIRKGATLIAALEAASDWSAQFDMRYTLKWFAWSGAITGFRIAGGA